MSHRLQVLIPDELDLRMRKAAQRRGVSKGEWVRRTIESALDASSTTGDQDPVDLLAALDAPTADIDQMLDEIESGRQ